MMKQQPAIETTAYRGHAPFQSTGALHRHTQENTATSSLRTYREDRDDDVDDGELGGDLYETHVEEKSGQKSFEQKRERGERAR